MAIPKGTRIVAYTGGSTAKDANGNLIRSAPKTFSFGQMSSDIEEAVGKRWTRVSIVDDHAASDHQFILADGTTKAITVTLPTLIDNAWVTVKKIDASVNTVTLTAGVSGLIDGAATLVLSSQWEATNVYCDGANWFVR